MLQLFRSKTQWIFDFTIYGERHSGTNFLEQCIKQQFGLDITYFYGFKHFFGWMKPEFLTYRGTHTLFIGITRNPYDWILALQHQPHHIPKANRKFPDFLLNEWYSVNGTSEILQDRNYTNKKRYKNIFELRREKNIYLAQILPVVINNYVLLSYDDLRYNHYQTMNIIGSRFDLKTIGTPPPFIGKEALPLSADIKKIIDDNIDWSVEATLGYFPK